MITLAPRVMVLTRSMARQLSNSDQFVVEDRPNDNMFIMKLNSKNAIVQYSKTGDVYNLIHSEIPDEYSGRGYGSILAKKTFDHIANSKMKMKLTCEFLQMVYTKNEHLYKELLAKL